MRMIHVLCCLCSTSVISAQVIAFPQAELSNDAKNAMQQIQQKRVAATVMFLASDELAGRDTPSPELQIAASYVASRFRGANLVGGGKDGSFFQPSKIATATVPQSGVSIAAGGKPVPHFGLLGAGNVDFEFTGKIEFVTEDENLSNRKFEGPVAMAAGEMSDPRAESNIIRRAQTLIRRGATAVLIQVPSDSPLVARAARNVRPRIINPRERVSNPTLLVPPLDSDQLYSITIPPIVHGETEVQNVIGLIRGSDSQLSTEAIIFSAHLDHIGFQPGLVDPVFNGADDDASGVTAVLSLADAYAALTTPPKRTVIFMAFWGEEKGLLGSRYYVNHPLWPLEKTVANINIEMIGRPEAGAAEKIWMTGWDQSDLGKLMDDSARRVGIEVFEHPQYSRMLYRASDNAPFVDRGVIAHSFSAGSLHSDYHRPSDEWQKLDLKHMTSVIKGLFAGSLPIADGDVTPKK